MGVAALLDVWGEKLGGPRAGSEILCVLTHGMGSTPPHPITPPYRCAALARVELEFVGLATKAVTRDSREGSVLLSMQPVGCTLWCSTVVGVDVASCTLV